MKLREFISSTLREHLEQANNLDSKISCIQAALKQELGKYNNEDDRWFEVRSELRYIDGYFENGHFHIHKGDTETLMNDFTEGLDFSNSHTYVKGEQVRILPNGESSFPQSKVPVFRATGDKVLFRGVSVSDWERIQSQGFIDSDMRDAILPTEGINLGQTPSTARYYLPHNDKGVMLAISPKNLDLYMLNDEYIRIFEPIPIENVLKVSDVVFKDKIGGILSMNTEQKLNDMLNRLREAGIEINC